MSRPCSITIFLADGVPDGLRVVEKSDWIGQAVVCPRSRFPDAKAGHNFFARTGVYILCGPATEGESRTIYIGEGDPTRPRLEQHYREKDFWNSLIEFSTKHDYLHKAHVQYLESRLVSLAREAKRCILDNGNDPQLPTLGLADKAAMDAFLEEILLICPLLGLNAFELAHAGGSSDAMLYLKRKGVAARGYEVNDGFIVVAGSQAVGDAGITSTASASIKSLRSSLVQKGVLTAEGNHLRFSEDYTFSSPSQAASLVIGGQSNGLLEWHDGKGRELRAIRQAALGG